MDPPRRMTANNRSKSRRAIIGALIASVSLWAQGCTEEVPAATETNPPVDQAAEFASTRSAAPALQVTSGAAPGYVGQEACSACHAEITAMHRLTAMGKSFFRPTQDDIIEDFQNNRFHHEASDRYYEVGHRDNEFFIKRYLLDSDGERYNEFEQRIDYVFGSGNNSRGYVYLNDAGEMFQMPIAWYTHEQKWGMAPGFDAARHDGFSRPISRACMYCHNAYPDVPVGSDHFGAPNRFPVDLPEGIDCGRCHGPGEEHVRVASDQSATPAQVRDSILNPASLDGALQLDVCLQCHLEITSKQTSIVGRFGKPAYAYEPGEPAHEYMVHFDHGDATQTLDRFQIGSAAYRLMDSTCFKSSNGDMTCTTCHDPHRHVMPADRAAFYRPKCLTCHDIDDCSTDTHEPDDPLAQANDCTACHMPQRRAQDVVHVVMTDHKIQRFAPGRDPLAPLVETPPPDDAPVSFLFPDLAPSGPIGDVYLAIPDVRDGVDGAVDRLREAIAAARPDAIEPYIELGAAELTLGEFASAAATFEHVLAMDPNLAIAHVNLGGALAAMGKSDEAIDHLRRAIELDPGSPDAHYNLASLMARADGSDEAVELYEKALHLRPNYAKCHFNLGNLLARAQQYDQAIVHYRRALEIDPDAGGYRNLGKALSYQGRVAEALVVWRRGLSRHPQHGEMACDLAEALLGREQPIDLDVAEALKAAVSAARADQRSGRFARAVALALVLSGEYARGLATAQLAVQLGADRNVCMLIAAAAMKHLNRADAETIYHSATRSLQQNGSADPLRRAAANLADDVFGASRR